MAQGKELLLFLSADQTDAGAETELTLQGDLTVNLGKQAQNTQYKNGGNTFVQDDGMSLSFTVGLTSPQSAAETLLFAAHDNESITYAWLRNSVTGGIEYAGEWRVAIGTINTPISGDTQAQVTMTAQGQPVRSVAA